MHDWGKFQRLSQRHLDAERAEVFPWASINDAPKLGVIEQDALVALIKRRYRSPTPPVTNERQEDLAIDEAFKALRAFGDLYASLNLTSVCETHGVRVQATSAYLGVNRNTRARVYGYRIRIANVGSPTVVQLRSRHWVIREGADADGGSVVVVPKGSPGVVGQTPRLALGHHFEYVSGTELHAERGSIRGSFEFVDDDGGVFDADVAPFDLVATPLSSSSDTSSGSSSSSSSEETTGKWTWFGAIIQDDDHDPSDDDRNE